MQKLTDYSDHHQSSVNYDTTNAQTLEDITQVIAEAYRQKRPLRIRGNGHSMNSSSLPRDGELLLLTTFIRHFRFEKSGTITVGAGAAIWNVNLTLKNYGYELLVYNDGTAPASTVGGYLSAGGIGATSQRYGGFWETVEHVILVNGCGEAVRSAFGDGIFEWLFGSMSQLGYIYEVCLKIRPIKGTEKYPQDITGEISSNNHHWNKLAWYNLFTTPEHAEEAIQGLKTISHVHKRTWVNLPLYRYDIAFKKFNPPLIYPRQESLVALGIWGEPWHDKGFDIGLLRLLEADFAEFILEKTYFRRYVQAEFTFEDFDYTGYFGSDVVSGFKKVKHQLDPQGIFTNLIR
nr:FAD-binding oxidoreductase [uncultured Pedobacter sp.]